MRVTTCHVDDLEGPVEVDVAVVIDVVRAFTAAPWCLARGAGRLLFAVSVEAAVAARAERYPDALLLKDRGPDPRFELPNSPGRIAREDLTGRTVIQVTGNGTRGAYAVDSVPLVLCASFATAAATVRAVRAAAPERVLLVPTEGDEDVALADYLTAMLDGGASVFAPPYLARVVRSAAGQECLERGADPRVSGVDPDDLRRCMELDVFDLAVRAAAQPDGLLAVTPC